MVLLDPFRVIVSLGCGLFAHDIQFLYFIFIWGQPLVYKRGKKTNRGCTELFNLYHPIELFLDERLRTIAI